MTLSPSVISVSDETATAAGSRNQATIFLIAGVAVTTAAVSLLTINHMKDVVVALALRGRPIGLADILRPVGPVDAVLFVPAIAAILALAWLEVWHRGCSRLLSTASQAEAFILLTIIVAWCGHAYLSPGVLLGGDTATHISRFNEVKRGIETGELPFWTNYQYAGAPLLWFTGPLTFVVGGFIAYLVQDAVAAAKILLFGLHVIGGWISFAFLRRLGIRPIPAMLGACLTACSFAHLHLFLYRGVIPQAFTIVFLVLLFYAADGLLRAKGPTWANMLIFSLATAAMIINHQPHALFAALYLAVFGSVALLTGFWRWRGVPILIMAGLLGAVASAFAVVPVILEADWVMIEPDGMPFNVHAPTIDRLLHLILWRNTRTTWGMDYWAYLGLGLIVFGAAGIAALFSARPKTEQRGVTVAACVCLALGFWLYSPVVRDIIFLLFFLGILAALGLDWLIERRILAGRTLALAVLLVTLDLASTSVQPVARIDKNFLIEAGRQLERTAPTQRVVQISSTRNGGLDADIGPQGGPLSYYSTVQRVAGNHNMAATRIHNFLAATAKLVETDLRGSGQVSTDTMALLALFNVGSIICDTPIAMGCPTSTHDAVDDAVLGRHIPVAATPAVFSQDLTILSLPRTLEKPMLWSEDFASAVDRQRIGEIHDALHSFLKIEDIDPIHRTARALAVQDPVQSPERAAADSPWQPVILNYSVGLDVVNLEVKANGPGYVQLSHPWFPSTRVTVNGVQVRPIRGAIELMVVPIGSGISVIRLRDGWTPVRMLSAIVSMLGFVTITGASVLLYRRGDRAVSVAQQTLPPRPL